MNVKVYTLNAFAKTEDGGNPAGVVLDSDLLSSNYMQEAARNVGYSETAFVQKSDKADFKLRFFTPIDEVDLCGHATIAAFYLLASKKKIKHGRYTQETKAGILDIEVRKDNTIFMSQNKPSFFQDVDKAEIADSLNIPEELISSNMPVQIVSTGLKDIIVPIMTLHDLSRIEPDQEKISMICRKYGVIGYHLFTLETKSGSSAHCRNFAPLYGIPEESATGTSCGALACYLFNHGMKQDAYVFEQGYSMNRPSEILASLEIQGNEIMKVKVGGTASNIRQMEISIHD